MGKICVSLGCACANDKSAMEKPTLEAELFHWQQNDERKSYAKVLRNHWGIENNLHWQLDVSFAEDGNRVTQTNRRARIWPCCASSP